jgi:hypothetical protein
MDGSPAALAFALPPGLSGTLDEGGKSYLKEIEKTVKSRTLTGPACGAPMPTAV